MVLQIVTFRCCLVVVGAVNRGCELTKRVFVDVGVRVTRKRDGAPGVVVNRSLCVPSVAHPGIYGKTVLSIRLDDAALAAAAGGDMVGDLSWFTSCFRVQS